MSTTIANASTAPGLRQDAGVIGLVGLAHMISHFNQLLLAPLFPWLKDAFQASYTELGFLMTLFFVVSCAVQAISGFLVDRYGPRPILFAGLALLATSAFGYSVSPSYWSMAFFSIVAGVGNGVFHPVNYTLINRKVSPPRLGHAYSVHGITGSLGWALAPAMLVPLAIAFSWRTALMGAGTLALTVMAVLWLNRGKLALPASAPAARHGRPSRRQFRIPANPRRLDVLFLLLFLRRGAERHPGVRARGSAPVAWRADRSGGHVPHGLHGVQCRRHGARRLSGLRSGALRAHRRHRLRPRGAGCAGDRPGFRSRAGGACPVRGDGLCQRHRGAFARPARETLHAGERDRTRVRHRLFRPGYRPGHFALDLRNLDGPPAVPRRLARAGVHAGSADHQRIQRAAGAPHGADHAPDQRPSLARRLSLRPCTRLISA